MGAPAQPSQNRLLGALPPTEEQHWMPLLESVDLPLGHVLYESGTALAHVYFPTTAIVSLLYVMEDGASAEIALVGNEGIVGVSLFMGGESTTSRAVVQSAGQAFRLEANVMKEEFDRAGAVLHLLLRYTQALITQMAQTAVCNRYHTLDQQLCRWLLLSLDRLEGTQLVMTQKLIADMLGVRREGVSEEALKLQDAGLIRYTRGHITERDWKSAVASVIQWSRRSTTDCFPQINPRSGGCDLSRRVEWARRKYRRFAAPPDDDV
jgi:CRP-like cAMP-binding protein